MGDSGPHSHLIGMRATAPCGALWDREARSIRFNGLVAAAFRLYFPETRKVLNFVQRPMSRKVRSPPKAAVERPRRRPSGSAAADVQTDPSPAARGVRGGARTFRRSPDGPAASVLKMVNAQPIPCPGRSFRRSLSACIGVHRLASSALKFLLRDAASSVLPPISKPRSARPRRSAMLPASCCSPGGWRVGLESRVELLATGLAITSSARGASPPLRSSTRRNAARAARSAKNVSVCMAMIFSAAATTRNWFMLVPSRSLIASTAAFSDRAAAGERFRFASSCLDPPDRIGRPAHGAAWIFMPY